MMADNQESMGEALMGFWLAGALVVLVAGIVMGQFSKTKGVRAAGRGIVLIYIIALAALIVGCIGIMIKAPHGSNSGVLIFPAGFFAFIMWILWGVWASASEWDGIADKNDQEKLAWLEKKSEDMAAGLREELRQDRAEVGKFWISPSRRRKLRARISENEFLLKHAQTMDDRYRDHLEKKAAVKEG